MKSNSPKIVTIYSITPRKEKEEKGGGREGELN